MTSYDSGEHQVLNPALQLGKTVVVNPSDVDAIVYGLDKPVSGVIVGYRYGESIVIQDNRKKKYVFKMEQVQK